MYTHIHICISIYRERDIAFYNLETRCYLLVLCHIIILLVLTIHQLALPSLCT